MHKLEQHSKLANWRKNLKSVQAYAMLPDMVDDRLIGSDEAAEILGINRHTLTRHVRQGKVPAVQKLQGKTGGYLFAYAAIAKLAAERRAA
jgi:hypothetical protein